MIELGVPKKLAKDKVTEAFLIRLLSSILLISTNQPTVRKRIQFLNF